MKTPKINSLFALGLMLLAFETANAARCDAHFPFDGSLVDASGNGRDGLMVSAGGGADPQFGDGKYGQALHISGSAAMRSFLDLHHDVCPQFTITAWFRLASVGADGAQTIFSTGASGGTPSMVASGTSLTLYGNGNGLTRKNAIRGGDTWFYVAATFDYEARAYKFYWNNRAMDGKLSEKPYAAEDSFWIGARNDDLKRRAQDLYIDDVHIYGRVLNEEEIRTAASNAVAQSGAETQTTRSAMTDSSGTGLGAGVPQGVGPISDSSYGIDPESVQDALDGRTELPLSDANTAGSSTVDIDLQGPISNEPQLTQVEDTPGQILEDNLQRTREATPDLPAAIPVDELNCETSVSGSIAALRSNGEFPAEFTMALRRAQRCEQPVRVASLNTAGQWIVSTNEAIAVSENAPAGLRAKARDFVAQHGGLTAGDIAENGAWLMASGTKLESEDLPYQALTAIGAATSNGRQIYSFDFNQDNNNQWVMMDRNGNFDGFGVPAAMQEQIDLLRLARRNVHVAKFAPGGGWLLIGSHLWFASEGLAVGVIDEMVSWRRAGRRVDHVVFNGSATDYLTFSPRTESYANNPIAQIEQNVGGASIWSRMENYNLAAVSIAVVRDNKISWQRGYGLRNPSDRESYVRVDTTFDAASISKPIATFGLLQLVEQGQLSLTAEGVLEPIEQLLSSINRPGFRDRVRPEDGNLIQLLQHCAAFCYQGEADCVFGDGGSGGAAEYPTDKPIPTIAQLLRGSGPVRKDSRPIRDANHGIKSKYSSVNWLLVQALIELHGGGFENHMGQLLLDLGMTSSTYRSPYPRRSGGKFARGWTGTRVEPMVAYGEMAAASLVSTPSDIARFVIAVNKLAKTPGASGPLSSEMAGRFIGRNRDIYAPQDYGTCRDPSFGPTQTWGLGVRRKPLGASGIEFYTHGGVHNGYRTQMWGYPSINSGLVVFMTGNSGQAGRFFNELSTAFRNAYF